MPFDKINDLEQQILKAEMLNDDIKLLANDVDWTVIDPKFMNRLLSVATVYQMRIEECYELLEEISEQCYIKIKQNESKVDMNDVVDNDDLIDFSAIINK
jgi:3'-phosphoadenosine 5'-phosphosulfate sulfotransferase